VLMITWLPVSHPVRDIEKGRRLIMNGDISRDGLLDDESDPLEALMDAQEDDAADPMPAHSSPVPMAADATHTGTAWGVDTHDPATPTRRCAVCGVSAITKCAQCGRVYYCSRQHQKQAWHEHKPDCAPARPKVSRPAKAPTSPADGTVVGPFVYVNGSQYPLTRWLHFTAHQGAEVAQAFRRLSPAEQVEALLGQRQVVPVLSPHLPSGCTRGDWCGHNGTRCNGCGLARANIVESAAAQEEQASEVVGFDPVQAIVCKRCRYTACVECAEHYLRGQCFCKHENFGVAYPPLQQRSAWETGFW
jgi:hypothetical protein